MNFKEAPEVSESRESSQQVSHRRDLMEVRGSWGPALSQPTPALARMLIIVFRTLFPTLCCLLV